MADLFMFGMYFIGFGVIGFCIVIGSIGIYGAMEEKRIYEAKVAQRNAIIRQQQKERDKKEREERDKAISGG